MQKPITVEHQELLNAITSACNNSNLPSVVKLDILEHIVTKLRAFAGDEYKRDLDAYQKALAEEEAQAKREEAAARAATQTEHMEPFTGEVNMDG